MVLDSWLFSEPSAGVRPPDNGNEARNTTFSNSCEVLGPLVFDETFVHKVRPLVMGNSCCAFVRLDRFLLSMELCCRDCSVELCSL
jgi:hypothetical protein